MAVFVLRVALCDALDYSHKTMRRVNESELQSDFERQWAWGDDQRHYYHPLKKKTSVMTYFLRLNLVLDLVKKYVKPGARVADLASAQGNYALKLAEMGFDVTAVDINEVFLKYSQKKYTHGKFKTVHSNIMDFHDPEGFDAVILGEVIEHVAFPHDLLRAALKNLKPGGVAIVTTPNGGEFGQPLPTYSQVDDVTALIPRQFHWGDHLFLYTQEELEKIFKEVGFEPVECLKFNSSYVSQIKGIRFLMPMVFLNWLETKARSWKKSGKDSTNGMIMVGRSTGQTVPVERPQ